MAYRLDVPSYRGSGVWRLGTHRGSGGGVSRLAAWRMVDFGLGYGVLPLAVGCPHVGLGLQLLAFRHVPALLSMRRGVLAAVVGLLILTMFRLAKPMLGRPLSIGVALVAFVVANVFHISVAWVVVGAGIVSE
jgi:hypothetical protein